MNDYQMIHLASSRSHDFGREAQAERLARAATRHTNRHAAEPRTRRPRGTLRLSFTSLLGRFA